MPDLSAEQFAQLVGNGECHIHSHPKEQLDFSDRLELMVAEPDRGISSNTTLTKADELVKVDTTTANVTITLPPADKGREFQIVKIATPNVAYVVPTAPDTVLGSATGVVIYNQFTSIHLKAVSGGYILV